MSFRSKSSRSAPPPPAADRPITVCAQSELLGVRDRKIASGYDLSGMYIKGGIEVGTLKGTGSAAVKLPIKIANKNQNKLLKKMTIKSLVKNQKKLVLVRKKNSSDVVKLYEKSKTNPTPQAALGWIKSVISANSKGVNVKGWSWFGLDPSLDYRTTTIEGGDQFHVAMFGKMKMTRVDATSTTSTIHMMAHLLLYDDDEYVLIEHKTAPEGYEAKMSQKNNGWLVSSDSSNGSYKVVETNSARFVGLLGHEGGVEAGSLIDSETTMIWLRLNDSNDKSSSDTESDSGDDSD
jgi:hypothetical protein